MFVSISLFGLACIALIALYGFLNVGRRGRNYAPGPRTLPLVGNLHQIPRTGAHERFLAWFKQYGGIYSLKLGTATAVVLTDRRLIKNLLDKRSSIYSNRPPSYVSDLVTGGDYMLVMDYGASWRTRRKVMYQYFMESMVEKHHIVLQNAEAVQMLRDFCTQPELHMLHPKRFSNSIITSILYGIRTPSCKTAHLESLYDYMDRFSEILEAGATPPVDFYPFLKWIPERFFGNYETRARQIGKAMRGLYEKMLDTVIERRHHEGRRDTFLDSVLDQQEKLQLSRDQLSTFGGVIMDGGTDTSASTLLAFIHAMIKWPQVQRKAHEEIDAVIGEDRSPTWSDYDQLPYVRMIIKEVMRWRPASPIGFPHCLAEDDWVDGYFLPKGSTVILNIWGLHHDESRFPNPEQFIPERYVDHPLLAPPYAASADYERRDHYSYGAGRRLCPGIHLAERNLFLGMSKLLWAFTFRPALNDEGDEIPLDVDTATAYTEGFLHCPKPFGCRIQPRSEKRRETIFKEFEEVNSAIFSRYQ